MKSYYLLIRRISAYTGPDLLLGAFDSEAAAQEARKAYLQRYRPSEPLPNRDGFLPWLFPWFWPKPNRNPKGDPWHEQGYKADGLVEQDLVIQPFDLEGELTSNEISAVSCYFDAMGQIGRKIDSLHPNRLLAERRMEEIRRESHEDDGLQGMPPNFFSTQTIRINEIQSDKPEHQPVLD